uniref:Ribosomal protein S9 n=1 Tax=Pteridomonas sp. YPF1301 TaxID=2766739 RepID=A0A7G1MPM8_9STRA|nr:ribosomal protein S9 [Pteridomonas sp. YPF1301]
MLTLNFPILNTLYTITTRKNACAQINIKKGTGALFINKKFGSSYFLQNNALLKRLNNLLISTPFFINYNIFIIVIGGGLESQFESIFFGLLQILIKVKIFTKHLLKKLGIRLTDYRIKERKKYGLKKARKASQFSKR